MIFALFIIGNGYESLVTSFMLDPLKQPMITTIDELFDSDMKFYGFYYLDYIYEENPKYGTKWTSA